MRSKKRLALGLAAAAVILGAAGAMLASSRARALSGPREGLGAGATLATFSLADQRDGLHAVDRDTRLLLFTTDKAVAKTAFELLDAQPGSYLADRRAAFVLDIAAMPGVITRFIAKPRMQRHAFPLLLDTGGATKAFPTREGRLTVLHLDALTVEKVEFVSGPEELAKVLGAMATGAVPLADR